MVTLSEFEEVYNKNIIAIIRHTVVQRHFIISLNTRVLFLLSTFRVIIYQKQRQNSDQQHWNHAILANYRRQWVFSLAFSFFGHMSDGDFHFLWGNTVTLAFQNSMLQVKKHGSTIGSTLVKVSIGTGSSHVNPRKIQIWKDTMLLKKLMQQPTPKQMSKIFTRSHFTQP